MWRRLYVGDETRYSFDLRDCPVKVHHFSGHHFFGVSNFMFVVLRFADSWSRPFSTLWIPMLLAATANLPLLGCGKVSHGDRLPIAGAVTKGGELLQDNATIYFEPIDGQAGVGSSGGVAHGKFSIPVESGPTPGLTYKVRVITAPGIPADGTPKNQMRLPQRYETTVEIPAAEGKAPQELQIEFE
jgi:hypothetical protein